MSSMKTAHVTHAASEALDDGAPALTARGDQVRIEVRHLKLLRAVVREQGLTRAALRLHLTQPALSHQLADLERRLGRPLFLRAGRRLVPTAAGERLVRAAESVLPELERAEQELSLLGEPESGLVRVSTECYTAYHWLPAALEEFGRRFPKVTVQIVVEATRRPIPALLEGRLDLAIVSARRGDRRLEHHVLFDDEMLAVMAPHHRLAAAGVLTPALFASETLVLYSIPIAESDFYRRFLRPAGVMPARVMRVELTEAILEMVRAGQGVAVLAGWAVAPEVRAGRLLARRVGRRGLRRRWYAAVRARQAPEHLRAFIDQVRRLAPAGTLARLRTGTGRSVA
jgi:LysR family transcriptional regulator, regulator for metE and metH